MVIPAGAQKRCRITHALGQLESEHAGIKRDGAFEIGHLQMDVPDVGAWVDSLRHTSHDRATSRAQTSRAARGAIAELVCGAAIIVA
jgi:hypothetical protein